VPSTVPERVGPAAFADSITATLNTTSPVIASATSSAASRAVSRAVAGPRSRATASRIAAAAAYRTACPPYTG